MSETGILLEKYLKALKYFLLENFPVAWSIPYFQNVFFFLECLIVVFLVWKGKKIDLFCCKHNLVGKPSPNV